MVQTKLFPAVARLIRGRVVVAGLASALLLTACGDSDTTETEAQAEEAAETNAQTEEAAESEAEPAPTEAQTAEASSAADCDPVTVIENDWTSQLVQTRLIQEVISQGTCREVNTLTLDLFASFPALANGDGHVHMEGWDNAYKDAFTQYIETEKSITSLGTLSFSAHQGWHTFRYVMEGDEERGIEPSCPGLPNWEALKDCAEVFSTPQTAPMGTFLHGAAAWIDAYGDQQRIDNLELPYEIRPAGSEAALVAEMKSAFDRGEPLLFYMWAPHWAQGAFDLVPVEFPEYTDECWATDYACGYQVPSIHKLVWSGLPDAMPDVAKIVEAYDLNDDQMNEMLIRVEGGDSIETVVEEWMTENEDVWRSWLE